MQLPRTLTSTPSRILELLYYIPKSEIARVGLVGGEGDVHKEGRGGPWCSLGTMVVLAPREPHAHRGGLHTVRPGGSLVPHSCDGVHQSMSLGYRPAGDPTLLWSTNSTDGFKLPLIVSLLGTARERRIPLPEILLWATASVGSWLVLAKVGGTCSTSPAAILHRKRPVSFEPGS